ncbi:MAG TPA: hypothetical protein VKE42_01380 [Candidatus Cybelea sp.]|nr:hypothetical protein [Candidatus Cybelea sp.]
MTDTAIEQRDDADLPEQLQESVETALLAGRTVNSVRKQYNLTIDQIDAIIARTWPVDHRARVRMIMTDLGKLDRLIAEFYRRALVARDATAAAYATVTIKALERKHQLTGMDAATRVDLQITSSLQKAPTDHEKIKAAIMRLARGPNWRDLPPDDIDKRFGINGAALAPPMAPSRLPS